MPLTWKKLQSDHGLVSWPPEVGLVPFGTHMGLWTLVPLWHLTGLRGVPPPGQPRPAVRAPKRSVPPKMSFRRPAGKAWSYRDKLASEIALGFLGRKMAKHSGDLGKPRGGTEALAIHVYDEILKQIPKENLAFARRDKIGGVLVRPRWKKPEVRYPQYEWEVEPCCRRKVPQDDLCEVNVRWALLRASFLLGVAQAERLFVNHKTLVMAGAFHAPVMKPLSPDTDIKDWLRATLGISKTGVKRLLKAATWGARVYKRDYMIFARYDWHWGRALDPMSVPFIVSALSMGRTLKAKDLIAKAIRTTSTNDLARVRNVSDVINNWAQGPLAERNAVIHELAPKPPATFDGWLRLHERMNERMRALAPVAVRRIEHPDETRLKGMLGYDLPHEATNGSWKAIRLETVGDLRREGDEMHHCVGWAHVDACLAGLEVVYSLRGPKEDDRLTAALERDGILDIRGKFNRAIRKDEGPSVWALLGAVRGRVRQETHREPVE